MKLFFSALVAVGALASCAQPTSYVSSSSQPTQDPLQAKVTALRQMRDACFEKAKNSPAQQQLMGKVAPSVTDQSIVILSNNSKPNSKDKEAIAAWDQERTECTKYSEQIEDVMSLPAGYKAVLDAKKAEMKQRTAELYSGSLTFAQYAKYRQDIYNQIQAAWAQTKAEVSKNMSDANYRNQQLEIMRQQAEAARDAAATNAIVQGANIINNAGKAPPPSSPRNVTCTTNGPFTNCSAY